jgi:hypothetical protein
VRAGRIARPSCRWRSVITDLFRNLIRKINRKRKVKDQHGI